ncbi:Uma2 family endonuclease [Embleya sp. NBC_00888]|uniref:Uma2 family endonuclease n=1 Tax=Embleya sp. NBC_00888 TaxID=2975960 RepID=UPI00386DD0B7|nr:Uma2 family endonuclease [Embleya sp. NBC_00888]
MIDSTRPDGSGLAALFETLEAPDNVRVELIGGRIVPSPPPVAGHGGLLRRLCGRFLEPNMPEGKGVSLSPVTIVLPCSDADAYVPDLAVLDEDTLWDFDDWKLSADVVHLVVEVVSAGRENRHDDREVKPLGYASGPIPLYLLIDPLRQEVTLFASPSDGKYQERHTVPFGGRIPVPNPFDAVLDTSIFFR